MKTIAKIIIATIASSPALHAEAETTRLTFTELPYQEGTLYVAVSASGKQIAAQAIEISGDTAQITFEQPTSHKEIIIEAFQDLNDNKRLDFDTYGRPTEPCLKTSATAKASTLNLQLLQY